MQHQARAWRWLVGLAFVAGACQLGACRTIPIEKLPGEAPVKVSDLDLEGAKVVNPGELMPKLAVRPGGLLAPAGPLNPYRLVEDKKRIEAFWWTAGHFDVQVADPELTYSADRKSVAVLWRVTEGATYLIDKIDIDIDMKSGPAEVRGAPAEVARELRKRITFAAGDRIDMEVYRHVRHALAEYLRREHWGHAEVYSRAYLDRRRKRVSWTFFVDLGPKTRVGAVKVTGNRRVPEDVIRRRMGLGEGDPYGVDEREVAELDLLDAGSFAVARFDTTADNEFIVGALPPDSGGIMRVGQVTPEGALVARELTETIDLNAVVVEAPAAQVRLGAGGSFGSERLDTNLSTGLTLRDVFGAFQHLTLDGRVGYGWLWRGDTDEPLGVYGSAHLRYTNAGAFGRTGDFRVTAEMAERLRPGYHLRQVTSGPGVRTRLARDLYLEIDALFRWQRAIGLGTSDPAHRDALDLADTDDDVLGGQLRAWLLWDTREDKVEPVKGHLLGLRATYSPGGPLGTHRWLKLEADARVIVPVGPAGTPFSIALRAAGGWLLLGGDEGYPTGERLLGGGGYAHRGFATDRLSPQLRACRDTTTCRNVPVGGLSLAQTSLEFRWLPYRKQWGGTVFVDAGGAGAGANPFEDGLSVAVGLSGIIRTWYLPLGVTVAYRVTDHGAYDDLDHFQIFLRIGEAF